MSVHPLLCYAPKDTFGPKVTIEPRLVRVIDARIAGLFMASMVDHPGSMDLTITQALRNAYMQGFSDGANRPWDAARSETEQPT